MSTMVAKGGKESVADEAGEAEADEAAGSVRLAEVHPDLLKTKKAYFQA